MKIDIIIVYQKRYKYGHCVDCVPSITGIHLAAITPPGHEVRVIHQQVQRVNLETDADVIAISFFSGFAEEAYRLARQFRLRGKRVIAGGPHVSFCTGESLQHFDTIVTGEVESVWATVIKDAAKQKLSSLYRGSPDDLKHIPTPRYDLLPDNYVVKKVVQATRGCYYTCSFCSVPRINPGFRMRPVSDVLKDCAYDHFPFWWQRKIVWFWDDNLTANRQYIKKLLKGMVPLKKWWLTQASIDVAWDDNLLDLMKASGCIGIFIGIESFEKDSLIDAQKHQNKLAYYKKAVSKLHKRGICVMAGFIAGFDHDTQKSITKMSQQLLDIGIDVPFLSILTPFCGTQIYEKLKKEGRLIPERGWRFWNGYNVSYYPAKMIPGELLQAHRYLWRRAFSLSHTFKRVLRGFFRLRFGAFCLSLAMNSFYCLKNLRGNIPVDMGAVPETTRQANQSGTPRTSSILSAS